MDQILVTLGSFALTGAIVSAIAQFTKKWISTKANKIVYVIFLSFLAGVIAFFARLIPANIIEMVLGIWASANTFYLIFMRWFNTPTELPK